MDQGVDQFTPAGQRVTHCTCARTGRHLATFTRQPGSSLYTLSTASPPVPASGQVAASSQVLAATSGSGPESAPCSCRLLSHQTLLWHHRLGHPSLPRLRGMASRVLVSGLPRSLPPLPPGPAPTCVPCVEGRQRAAPQSSEFPLTEAPLQTLHMDVWGSARVRGQGHERYFLLVVDDYSRYTTVFPLCSKGEVTEVLIDWIPAARLRLRASFGSEFPVLRLHSDRGGEFSSARLGAFCHAQGIRQTFTLPASPQKNGIAERRIGMVMDFARTSMIHAAAPHFLWPFAPSRAALPSRTALHYPTASTTTAATAATLATAPPAAMASPTVLTFDAEGRAVDVDVWVDDLQIFLQCDSRDGVSLFDHTSGVSTAPAATADIARYSSPATAALSRLMLPYLFLDLAAFATVADLVADLVAHLRTSDARYRVALPTEDHFLSLCPTELTVDLLEEHLAAVKKSILAVGASRGDPHTPFFEGCSPVPLLPSVASASAVNLVGTEEVGAASAPSGRHRNSKGKGSKGGGGGGGGSSGGGGGGGEGGIGGGGGTGSGGVSGGGGGSGGSGGGGGGSGSGGGGGGSGGAGQGAAAQHGGFGGSQRQQQLRSRETPSVQQLREWYAGRGRSGGAGPCTYVFCTGCRRGETAEGDCYLSVPPDPGIAAAALGASAFAAPGAGASALFGTAPTEALHTFTLDSSASRSFFRDSTTFTPLSRPVAVSLADPSGGPVLAHYSTVLPCPAALSGLLSGLHLPSFSTNLVSGADLQDVWVDQFTLGGQRVTNCTCSQTGLHLATFTRRPGSSLYTLTTAPPPVSAFRQVAASSQVFAAASRSSPSSAPCSCRPLSHETLLWHHRLGHPSLPRLRGMASRALVSGLLRSLPPLSPGPAPTCVPCVEGRQHAAPHSSSFPPTEAPLQTLHMDVWGPARVGGQGHKHYFQLVFDDYSRYTTVFPLRSEGEVPEVLIDWIRGARRQLSERFGSDLPVLGLHSDRGGEFSSDLLRAYCRADGIRQTFTLPASPQKNGIAERRIGMVMDVACMSMIHAAAPHFLWPFAVQYAAHQINLQPHVSLPETTPTLRWTGKVGDASVFRVWGSRAFVRDTSADKLSSRVVPCVFLVFRLDAPGWQFYHPTSRRVLSSQDVTFDEVLPP
ncbi:unnamed protein product [Closterium sp. NIES-54]